MKICFKLVFLFELSIIAARFVCSESTDYKSSLDHVLASLLDFTQNQTFSRPFNFNFSKSYIRMSSTLENQHSFLRLVTKYKHINEMCPKDFRQCWCGLLDDFKNFPIDHLNDGIRTWMLLKICSSEPQWLENKDAFMQDKFTDFEILKLANGTNVLNGLKVVAGLYKELFTSSATHIYEYEETEDFDMRSLEFNKHYPSLCPPRNEWCWCGVVGNWENYLNPNRTKLIVDYPNFIIDCRYFNKRPFEERDCRPESADSLPWHRKLFGPAPKDFPCGHY